LRAAATFGDTSVPTRPLLFLLAFLLAALLPAAAIVPSPAVAASEKTERAASERAGDRAKDKDRKRTRGKWATPAGCQFAKTAKTWTLKQDCTVEGTVRLPAGVALDGRGHTMALGGKRAAFDGAALLVRGGKATVRNLTVDGSRLSGQCSQWDDQGRPVAAIRFVDASGRIEGVAVDDHRCGAAVEVEAGENRPRHAVNLAKLEVSDTIVPGRQGRGRVGVVSFAGAVDATVTGVTLRRVRSSDGSFFDDALAAVWIGRGASATIAGATIEGSALGVVAERARAVVVRDSVLTDVVTGIEASQTVLDVVGNTIVGNRWEGTGVGYGDGTSGAVDGNEISGFTGPAKFQTACGIAVAASSQAEVGTGNRFPESGSDSANDQDVCDDRE